MDNSTSEDLLSQADDNLLSVDNADQTILKESSVKTQIDVESNTTFDVIGDYFKIKLSDENGNALKNTKVTFTLLKNTYTKTTNDNGIASLQLNLNDGSYNITTKFAGNSNYKSSSITTQITMSNTRVVDEGLSNSEIQKIIDNAKDKNVILFKGKSYSDINLVINKRLTLLSNVNTVLKSGSTSPVLTIKGKSASYTIVNGFNIQGNGNGNGDGSGDGSGNGGSSNQGSSDNTGNSTHSQNSDPSNSGTNQVNDASQNYDTQDVASQGASAGSSRDAGDAGSESVVKQILLDEDDIFRVTGISFIVLLIILTIGFYYRDDIKEMNSKR